VGPCFQQLAGLLGCAAEFDSQLAVFSLLDLIVDRLSEGVKPYAPGLLALLPSVWQQAEGQSLLRMQVSGAGRQGGKERRRDAPYQLFLCHHHTRQLCVSPLCAFASWKMPPSATQLTNPACAHPAV
jgi:hypothetical protein